jgi:hypothetical protein
MPHATSPFESSDDRVLIGYRYPAGASWSFTTRCQTRRECPSIAIEGPRLPSLVDGRPSSVLCECPSMQSAASRPDRDAGGSSPPDAVAERHAANLRGCQLDLLALDRIANDVAGVDISRRSDFQSDPTKRGAAPRNSTISPGLLAFARQNVDPSEVLPAFSPK